MPSPRTAAAEAAVSAPVSANDVATLDGLGEADFTAAVGPLFEGAPRFLHRLARARPFGTDAALFAGARAIALEMPEPEQVELIDAHPRLGAPPASVSTFSFHEQGYGHDAAGAETQRAHLQTALDRLNDAYEARFGFRCVIFVAGRPREALLPVFEERLKGERNDEKRTALVAVVAIAEDRWRKQLTSREGT